MALGKQCQVDFFAGASIGLSSRILQRLQQQADADNKFDWEVHYVDNSVIRAPTCIRGKKGEIDADSEQSVIEAVQEPEANGRSKGGLGATRFCGVRQKCTRLPRKLTE